MLSEKTISLQEEVCPYCNNTYDGLDYIITDCGFEFSEDGVRLCCHNCAIEAGLHIC